MRRPLLTSLIMTWTPLLSTMQLLLIIKMLWYYCIRKKHKTSHKYEALHICVVFAEWDILFLITKSWVGHRPKVFLEIFLQSLWLQTNLLWKCTQWNKNKSEQKHNYIKRKVLIHYNNIWLDQMTEQQHWCYDLMPPFIEVWHQANN